jgi:hypothetical protein
MSHSKRISCSSLSLLGGFVVAACASSSGLTPLNLSISTVEDTVVMQRNPNGAYFNVTAIVRNDDTRSLVVQTCLTPVQCELNKIWTTVFTPNCLSSGLTPLAAGDSVVLPVKVFAYTLPNTFPALDPRMEPGRYRLLLGVRLDESTIPTASARGELKPSASFIVK